MKNEKLHISLAEKLSGISKSEFQNKSGQEIKAMYLNDIHNLENLSLTSLDETLYLFKSKKNAARLLKSIKGLE